MPQSKAEHEYLFIRAPVRYPLSLVEDSSLAVVDMYALFAAEVLNGGFTTYTIMGLHRLCPRF